ncbi:MAG: sensor histidine kinase [Candidatus Limnocylindria bacterium]
MSPEDPQSSDLPPAAAAAVERAHREKDEFLDLVAHELKTPLTPLKTVAQLIRMRIRRALAGTKELDVPGLEKNAAMIERQVDRMDRLVTDLLEVSRIARGRFALRPEPFDVAEVARDVVRRWSEATEDIEQVRHRLDLDAPASLPLTGDRERVEHAIADLIGNAVKFSPSGGLVKVQVEGHDGEVAIAVRDQGIGIPASEIGLLGRAPFAGRERTKDYAGLGIGLYLVRVVAEGHGGRLDLASDGVDRGTTATITLRDMPQEDQR